MPTGIERAHADLRATLAEWYRVDAGEGDRTDAMAFIDLRVRQLALKILQLVPKTLNDRAIQSILLLDRFDACSEARDPEFGDQNADTIARAAMQGLVDYLLEAANTSYEELGLSYYCIPNHFPERTLAAS